MKAFSLTLLFTFVCFSGAFGQGVGYDRAFFMLNANQVKPVQYQRTDALPGRATVYLECPFASSEFVNPEVVKPLKGQLIEKVQLVYTTYRSDESFSQQKLNQQRLKNLQRVLPDAFTSALTEWELVGQTGADSPESGSGYFHGFVITYRLPASETTIRNELSFLDSTFLGKITVRKPGDTTSTTGSTGTTTTGSTGTTTTEDGSSVKRGDIIMPDGSIITLRKNIPEDSLRYYLRPSSPGATIITARYADTAHSKIVVTERFMDHKRTRTWDLEDHKEDPKGIDKLGRQYLNNPDSVVTTVLRRNSWDNFMLVCDVTGSMSPYTAQIFAALPAVIENRKCKGFIFFNDGDKKTTADKHMLRTGGLYATTVMRFDSVYYTAQKCMNMGDGGDLPENNVEALLRAEKMNPGGELVMIADNWATPRDLQECDKINSPVHIILCSAHGGVNPDYLFLARVTNGSVHTRDQDITGLGSMKENESVKIGNQTFILHDDHFLPLENFSKDY